ncbi:8-oxo-dGTP diphosphatase [Rhodotorula toruloides]
MSSPRPAPMTTSTDELGAYSDGELLDDPMSESLSAIEPLSPKSLKAISNLARYKPPPDPYPFPEGRSAVLVCLFGSRSGDNLNVLLSTRSQNLRTYVRTFLLTVRHYSMLMMHRANLQPGQVALPGGKMDDTDINLEATARREAFEEVGLPVDTTRIRYLTSLPPFLARSMMLVTPVVCFVLDYSLKPELNPSEVSDLFSFPLEAFLTANPSHRVFHHPHPDSVLEGKTPYHTVEDYPWFDGRKHRFHAFEAHPQPIVGLTAEILIHVAMLAYKRSPDFLLRAPDEMSQRDLIRRAMKEPKFHEFRRKWREKRPVMEREGKL